MIALHAAVQHLFPDLFFSFSKSPLSSCLDAFSLRRRLPVTRPPCRASYLPALTTPDRPHRETLRGTAPQRIAQS